MAFWKFDFGQNTPRTTFVLLSGHRTNVTAIPNSANLMSRLDSWTPGREKFRPGCPGHVSSQTAAESMGPTHLAGGADVQPAGWCFEDASFFSCASGKSLEGGFCVLISAHPSFSRKYKLAGCLQKNERLDGHTKNPPPTHKVAVRFANPETYN